MSIVRFLAAQGTSSVFFRFIGDEDRQRRGPAKARTSESVNWLLQLLLRRTGRFVAQISQETARESVSFEMPKSCELSAIYNTTLVRLWRCK